MTAQRDPESTSVGDVMAAGMEALVTRRAWEAAAAATPRGMLGPAIEPRYPDRWRAFYYWPDHAATSLSMFGSSQSSALYGLVEAARMHGVARGVR